MVGDTTYANVPFLRSKLTRSAGSRPIKVLLLVSELIISASENQRRLSFCSRLQQIQTEYIGQVYMKLVLTTEP